MTKTEKKLLQEFLDSRSSAGGLYGLTVSDPDFNKGLHEIINAIGNKDKIKKIRARLKRVEKKEADYYKNDVFVS